MLLYVANGLGRGMGSQRAGLMPIAVVEFAKINPELTKRLGQIAINWALSPSRFVMRSPD